MPRAHKIQKEEEEEEWREREGGRGGKAETEEDHLGYEIPTDKTICHINLMAWVGSLDPTMKGGRKEWIIKSALQPHVHHVCMHPQISHTQSQIVIIIVLIYF